MNFVLFQSILFLLQFDDNFRRIRSGFTICLFDIQIKSSILWRRCIQYKNLTWSHSSVIDTIASFFVRFDLFVVGLLEVLLFFAPQFVKLAEKMSLNGLLWHNGILWLFDFDLLTHDSTLWNLTLPWTSRKRHLLSCWVDHSRIICLWKICHNQEWFIGGIKASLSLLVRRKWN